MDPAIILAILGALTQFAADEPVIVNAVTTVIGLLKSGQAPTAAQQTSIDALLDAAHARLQGTSPPPPAAAA